MRWLEEESLMTQSPESHARFRRLFNRALTPRAVRRMDAQIREVVERFAAPLRGRPGEVLDLMGEFTNPIPNSVISRIVGVLARRRRGALPRARAGADPRLLPARAARRDGGVAEAALQQMAPWLRADGGGAARQRRART